jgi:hypothetical protein
MRMVLVCWLQMESPMLGCMSVLHGQIFVLHLLGNGWYETAGGCGSADLSCGISLILNRCFCGKFETHCLLCSNGFTKSINIYQKAIGSSERSVTCSLTTTVGLNVTYLIKRVYSSVGIIVTTRPTFGLCAAPSDSLWGWTSGGSEGGKG